MTTHEKAELIQFINYCEQTAESDRRASRKWDTQYCAWQELVMHAGM